MSASSSSTPTSRRADRRWRQQYPGSRLDRCRGRDHLCRFLDWQKLLDFSSDKSRALAESQRQVDNARQSLADQIANLLGEPEVDCAIDCVGFEARGHGHAGSRTEAPATVLNSLMQVTRVAGSIGIPGLYVTEDPGAADDAAKQAQFLTSTGAEAMAAGTTSTLTPALQ